MCTNPGYWHAELILVKKRQETLHILLKHQDSKSCIIKHQSWSHIRRFRITPSAEKSLVVHAEGVKTQETILKDLVGQMKRHAVLHLLDLFDHIYSEIMQVCSYFARKGFKILD
jgi:hypothetical protein